MGPGDFDEKCRRVRVLLVDDDRLALASLHGLLLIDYDVVAASSPLDALDIAREEIRKGDPFDVVCSDFRMPGMNGADLLLAMSRLPERPSCILMTGYVEVLTGEHRRSDHILGIVVKPYEPEHIISLVGRLGRVTRMNRSVKRLSQRVLGRRPGG